MRRENIFQDPSTGEVVKERFCFYSLDSEKENF